MSLEKVARDSGFTVSRKVKASGLRRRAFGCEQVLVIRYRGWFHVERSPLGGRFFVAVNENGKRLRGRLAHLVNPKNVKYENVKAHWELELARRVGGYVVTIHLLPTF